MSDSTPPAAPPAAPPATPPAAPPATPPADLPPITLDTPGVRELVELEVTGLKGKNADLLTKMGKLISEKQAAEDRMKGFDPKAFELLMKRIENDEEVKLIAEGKLDEVVARRLEAVSRPLEDQVAELRKTITERDDSLADRDGKIETMVFDRLIREVASDEKLGIQPTAIPDVTARIRRVFTKLDEKGEPVAEEYGKDGQPLRGMAGMKEWMAKQLLEQAPHCFIPSKGGGTVGNVDRGDQRKNPFVKETYNMNEATRLWREDPELAKRLKAEAEKGSA